MASPRGRVPLRHRSPSMPSPLCVLLPLWGPIWGLWLQLPLRHMLVGLIDGVYVSKRDGGDKPSCVVRPDWETINEHFSFSPPRLTEEYCTRCR